jgi:hypothetical protein
MLALSSTVCHVWYVPIKRRSFGADVNELSNETLVLGLHLGPRRHGPILVKCLHLGLHIHEDGLFAISNVVLHFFQGRVQDILFCFGQRASLSSIKALTDGNQARKLQRQREYAGSPHGYLIWRILSVNALMLIA